MVDVPFFRTWEERSVLEFFSHVKRQTDVAVLLSHEDSVIVLLFLVVRDVPKI